MEKTRVPKGEKYWYIYDRFEVAFSIEDNSPISNKHFETNNYFHTQEEAESMASKLRAVLKGADVLEMPSEEDITEKIFSSAGEIVGRDREITVSDCMKTAKAVVRWLIDKIVK